MKNLSSVLASFVLFGAISGCTQTTHKVIPAPPFHQPGNANHQPRNDPKAADHQPGNGSDGSWPAGRSTGWEGSVELLDEPGPIEFEKHVAADWVVPREGLINLGHDEAQAAHLEDGPEPIQIYFYILNHPEHGSFMVDSGIARSLREGKDMPVRFPVSSVLSLDDLKVHLDTKSYLQSRHSPIRGVFLTHLHLDHILGLTDVPRDVPLYIGPGEAEDTRFTHLFVRPTTNLNLRDFGPLREWQMKSDEQAPFPYVDVFSDQSVLGLHIPGHTKGSIAFLIRSTQGPILLVGDGSHTVWGWEHGVEPGSFNTDMKQAASSLDRLLAFAKEHPGLDIHLGHQSMPHRPPPALGSASLASP